MREVTIDEQLVLCHSCLYHYLDCLTICNGEKLVRSSRAHRDFFFRSLSSLNCTCLDSETGIRMKADPLALDANGDYIADLFGINENSTRG